VGRLERKNPEDRGLDSRGLASRLRKYKTGDDDDIKPHDVRIGDWHGKGIRDDLTDAWSGTFPGTIKRDKRDKRNQ
jgi:hypothetical protein